MLLYILLWSSLDATTMIFWQAPESLIFIFLLHKGFDYFFLKSFDKYPK